MSYRATLSPQGKELEAFLVNTDKRLTAMERLAMWPRPTVVQTDDPASPEEVFPYETTTPGYPFPEVKATLTLDPGRWIIMFRAVLASTGTEGGEVGMISTVEYDSITTSVTTRGSGATIPIGRGSSWTLVRPMEVAAQGQIVATLSAYWGYYPIDPMEPLPYAFGYFNGANIVAFPG